jgi:hypothetical protein
MVVAKPPLLTPAVSTARLSCYRKRGDRANIGYSNADRRVLSRHGI